MPCSSASRANRFYIYKHLKTIVSFYNQVLQQQIKRFFFHNPKLKRKKNATNLSAFISRVGKIHSVLYVVPSLACLECSSHDGWPPSSTALPIQQPCSWLQQAPAAPAGCPAPGYWRHPGGDTSIS